MFEPKIAFLFETGWLYSADEGCLFVKFDEPLSYHFCPSNHVYLFEDMIILNKRFHFPVIANSTKNEVSLWSPKGICGAEEAPPLSPMIMQIASAFGEIQDLDFFLHEHPAFANFLHRLPEDIIPK